MRLLFGPTDPAGVAAALAGGLRDRGHECKVVTWAPSPWGYSSDQSVAPGVPAARFASGMPRRFDAVHVLGGRSWLAYADLLWMRARGRIALIQYNGSDCRTSDIARDLHPARARVVDGSRDREIRIHRRIAGRAVKAALVQDLELVDYLRTSFRTIYVTPFAIDMNAVERARRVVIEPTERLSVVHAPSNREIKGSDVIARAVSGLDIEYKEVSGRHDEVLEHIAGADVVIDQLNAEAPGVLAAEAMALERPVICEYREHNLASRARPCPVVAATPASLGAEVASLASDPSRREQLGRAGRSYSERVHGPSVVAACAERVYDDLLGGPARGVFEARPEGLERVA